MRCKEAQIVQIDGNRMDVLWGFCWFLFSLGFLFSSLLWKDWLTRQFHSFNEYLLKLGPFEWPWSLCICAVAYLHQVCVSVYFPILVALCTWEALRTIIPRGVLVVTGCCPGWYLCKCSDRTWWSLEWEGGAAPACPEDHPLCKERRGCCRFWALQGAGSSELIPTQRADFQRGSFHRDDSAPELGVELWWAPCPGCCCGRKRPAII